MIDLFTQRPSGARQTTSFRPRASAPSKSPMNVHQLVNTGMVNIALLDAKPHRDRVVVRQAPLRVWRE